MVAITVAFQGLAGSFSSLAARKLFPSEILPINTTHFKEIFEHVTNGRADYGVLPIENAVAGSVLGNYDLLESYSCSIVGEIYIPVQLHLLIANEVDRSASIDPANLTRLYSHPKALEQCSSFIERYPQIEIVSCSDTAGAAKLVVDNHKAALKRGGQRPMEGAIASEEAGRLFGLEVLLSGIQNHPNNSTRFVAIALKPSEYPNPSKLSIILSLKHTPGSLATVLNEVARFGLNLTKIESRPILGSPYSYTFHIDIECESESDSHKLKAVVDAIQKLTTSVRLLGRYRRAL